jgi:hypothetical protein
MLTERRARRNGKRRPRWGWASKSGLWDQLRGRIAPALAEVFVDYILGSLFAASAATSDRQLVLHVKQRARPTIDTLADVFIGNGMAYADVHQSPSVTVRPDISLR